MTGFFLEAARLYLSAYGDNPCPFGAKIQTTGTRLPDEPEIK
jgi:hypothetical protein